MTAGPAFGGVSTAKMFEEVPITIDEATRSVNNFMMQFSIKI